MQKLNRQHQSSQVVMEEQIVKCLKSWRWAYNHGNDQDRAVWFHRLSCACERLGKKAIDYIDSPVKTSK